MLTRHQSSLKTNQISIGPYFLEIKEEKGSCWCKIKSTNFFDLSSQIWYFLKGKDLIITTENWKFAYSSVFLSNLVMN